MSLFLRTAQASCKTQQPLLEKYRENGIVVPDTDLDFTTHAAAEGRITCDNCLSTISDFDNHYYCGIYNDGDFDVCQKCIANRTFYLDQSHKLINRIVKDGALLEVPN